MTNQIFTYVIITLVLSLCVFLMLMLAKTRSPKVSIGSKGNSKIHLSFLLILISLLPYSINNHSVLYFFILFSILSTIIIFTLPRCNSMNLLLVIIGLMIVSRISIWNLAPIIGRDSRIHVGIAGYIVETGNVIPEAIWYYHWYPIAHIHTAVISHITSFGPSHSYILSFVFPASVSILFIYLFTNKIIDFNSEIPGLIAAIFIVFSVWHLQRTSIPFPQTLGAVYIAIVVFLMLYIRQKRHILLLLIVAASATLTHNLVAIVLTIIGVLYVSSFTLNSSYSIIKSIKTVEFSKVVLLLITIIIPTLYIWMATEAGFFELQIMRILRIFETGTGVEQTADGSEWASKMIPIGPFYFQLLLLYALPLLINGFFIAIASLYFASIHIGNEVNVSTEWLLVIIAYYSAIGAAFIVGEQAHIYRLFDISILVIAPLVGYVGYKLCTDLHHFGVIILAIVIILNPVVSVVGVHHGLPVTFVPATEQETPAFSGALEQSEVNGLLFAIEYDLDVQTDRYAAISGEGLEIKNGEIPSRFNRSNENNINTTTLELFSKNKYENEVFLYRTYYDTHTNTTIPDCYNIFYDSGGAKYLSGC